MSKSWVLKETVPWLVLGLLFAIAVRLTGVTQYGQPQGGATTEQLVRLHPAAAALDQGVSGTAFFSYDSAPDQTTVVLTAIHLVAGSVPRVQIRAGTCVRSGSVVQQFPAARVDEHGTLRVVGHRDGSFVLQHWVITVLAGADAPVAVQGRALACGVL